MLFLVLVFLFLSTGCGKKPQPDVEHFQGEVVATLQKPVSQATPNPLDTSLPPSIDPEETLPPTEFFPTDTPGDAFTATEENLPTTGYLVETGISPQTPQPSVTAIFTPTLTPTLGVPVWQGVWNIWYQTASGGYTPAELTVQISGIRLTGLAKIDGVDYTFKGDIYSEGVLVEGEWQTASNSGTFWWRMNSADTFVGSREDRFGFCGNRAAADQPNPCREVPQN